MAVAKRIPDEKASAAERLRQSRLRSGFATIRAACLKHGWPYSTYVNHENGTRAFSWSEARNYGPAFGVDADWLLSGKVNEGLSNIGDITANFSVIRKMPHLECGGIEAFKRIIMGETPMAPEGRSEPLPSSIEAGPRAFALTVPDDALANAKPYLGENSIGFFDPDAEIKTGDIVAALIDGYPVIALRKFRVAVGKGGKAAFDLISPDPDYLSFSSDTHEINLVGKLIGVWLRV